MTSQTAPKLAAVTTVRDLERSPLGLTGSPLSELVGEPVIRHVVRNACNVRGIHEVVVVAAKAAMAERLRAALEGLSATVIEAESQPPTKAPRLISARKWSRRQWGGGIGEATVFDEGFDAGLLLAGARHAKADLVLRLCPYSPFLGPSLLDEVVASLPRMADPVLFSQSPPGLSIEVYHTEILASLAASGLSPGDLLRYHPDRESRGLTGWALVHTLSLELMSRPTRLRMDSQRDAEVVRRLARHLEASGPGHPCARPAAEVLDAISQVPLLELAAAPDSLELEASFRRPAGSGGALQEAWSGLTPPPHPWSRRAAQAGSPDLDPDLATAAVARLASQTDVLTVSLGGPGDPLLHPKLGALLSGIQQAGAWGLHVTTSGLTLAGETAETLVDPASGVDVLSVTLGASQASTWSELSGGTGDEFAAIVANVDAFLELRDQGSPDQLPLVVIEAVKVRENAGELLELFDRWWPHADGVVIRGFDHRAGALADRDPLPLLPGQRRPCAKLLAGTMSLLADGRWALCPADVEARFVLGAGTEADPVDLWSSASMASLREQHVGGDFSHPLCRDCRSWIW